MTVFINSLHSFIAKHLAHWISASLRKADSFYFLKRGTLLTLACLVLPGLLTLPHPHAFVVGLAAAETTPLHHAKVTVSEWMAFARTPTSAQVTALKDTLTDEAYLELLQYVQSLNKRELAAIATPALRSDAHELLHAGLEVIINNGYADELQIVLIHSLIAHPTERVAVQAMKAASVHNDDSAIPAMIGQLNHPNASLRDNVERYLQQLTRYEGAFPDGFRQWYDEQSWIIQRTIAEAQAVLDDATLSEQNHVAAMRSLTPYNAHDQLIALVLEPSLSAPSQATQQLAQAIIADRLSPVGAIILAEHQSAQVPPLAVSPGQVPPRSNANGAPDIRLASASSTSPVATAPITTATLNSPAVSPIWSTSWLLAIVISLAALLGIALSVRNLSRRNEAITREYRRSTNE